MWSFAVVHHDMALHQATLFWLVRTWRKLHVGLVLAVPIEEGNVTF
jgi:hypothetical protein